MSPELPLAREFAPSTHDQWISGVEKVLAKGKSDLEPDELAKRFERELVTHLYDGIDVAPLYTAADVEVAGLEQFPGFFPFVRSGSPIGAARGGWDVRQPVDLAATDVHGAARVALDQLERGASSLFLRLAAGGGGEGLTVDSEVLGTVLEGVYLDLITVSLDASLGADAASGFLQLAASRQVPPAGLRGVLGLDPIGAHASGGGEADLAGGTTVAVDLAGRCAADYPHVRAVVVDATRYHDAGCSDSEELAFAVATGVAYLRQLTAAGLSLELAFGQIEFRFAATADQFLTVAKLRAARQLWSRIAQASGNATVGVQHQHALTSQAMLSRYDPWVNLLRGTIACFSAGIGGADAVTVETYDALVEPGTISELGRRLARNTQTILLEESHAARVVDPAGGSWYVESLTRSVAEESWRIFQTIESAGGMVTALDDGLVAERIEQTWEQRLSNLARRKDTITGVSDFPDAGEVVPPPAPEAERARGLPRRRYAAPFEHVRQRVDVHAARTGARPSVLLVNLGRASDYTARSTYAKSFFETAGLGIDAIEIEGEGEGALTLPPGTRVACLCSSDARYVEVGPAVVRRLKEAGLARIYLAGRKTDDLLPLGEAGVDEFIGVGCDVLDALRRVLTVFEVA